MLVDSYSGASGLSITIDRIEDFRQGNDALFSS